MLPRSDPPRHATVVVIGAGPRAIGWLERFAAARFAAAERPRVVVELIDPFPAGPGRIWRRAQSPLLKLNSMVEDVTMFTDDSCAVEGPVRPGPSLLEWVEAVRDGRIPDVEVDPYVADELARLRRGDFPTRRLHSYYLDWFLRRAIADIDDRAVVAAPTRLSPSSLPTTMSSSGSPAATSSPPMPSSTRSATREASRMGSPPTSSGSPDGTACATSLPRSPRTRTSRRSGRVTSSPSAGWGSPPSI